MRDATLEAARALGTSLHYQIFLVLRDSILAGRYETAKPLPTEAELCALFKVSRATVRLALQRLEAADLIERRQGVGTFVRAQELPVPLHLPITDLIDNLETFAARTRARIIESGFQRPPPAVQDKLQTGTDEVLRLVWIRERAGRPVLHLHGFVPRHVAEEFDPQALQRKPFHRLIQGRTRRFKRFEQIVSATLADPIIAVRLDVSVGAPLLELNRVYIAQDDQPVGYLNLLAPPDLFQIRMVLDGNGTPRRLRAADPI